MIIIIINFSKIMNVCFIPWEGTCNLPHWIQALYLLSYYNPGLK